MSSGGISGRLCNEKTVNGWVGIKLLVANHIEKSGSSQTYLVAHRHISYPIGSAIPQPNILSNSLANMHSLHSDSRV